MKVRTGLTEEREKRTTHGPCGFDAGRPLLTHHLQAQQRRGPSVFRHRGARGAGAPARGAHSPCALTRSRSGRCRCRTPERYHSVRSVTFRVASRSGRSELFSWNAMPRSATRQTLDKTPPCCSPLALRVKHCFRPSALPTRCFLRYFRFYGGGTRACRFLILFAPPLRLPSFFFFRFGGRKTCILNMALPKRASGKRPQALKARGKLLSNNFPNAKKKLRISTILLNSKPMLPVEGAPSGPWSCLFLLEFNSALILPFRTVT